MPKSSVSSSPQASTSALKPLSDSVARMTDVALRKKKNADAQAAFRARRANYIATLEETVTNLESVVLQLQESCRDSRNETAELRQENIRLRLECREREKFWRLMFNSRRTGRTPDVDDIPQPPQSLSSPFMTGTQVSGLSQQATVVIQQPFVNSMGYRGEDAPTCQGAYSGANFNGQQPSSSIPFSNNNESTCPDGSTGSSLNHHRVAKYSPYPYPITRDGRWPPTTLTPATTITDSGTPPHSQSPGYINSPSLTSSSDMTTAGYPTRFSGEDQKSSLNTVLDSAPYVFPNQQQSIVESVPNSRSLSPTLSNPSSNTPNPLTSYSFTFHEPTAGQERPEFDYRRHSLPNCPEVTLHGGTADVSLTGQSSDAVRYRVGSRKDSCAEESALQQPGSEGVDVSYTRSHRDTLSRSPSPGPTQLSCTVAVIKAQAFGSLRRTRTKTKRTAEGAHKVAMDVLEARGIGIGPSTGSKRPRLEDDDLEAHTP